MRGRFLWIGRRLSGMRPMSLSWTRQTLVCGCRSDNGLRGYRKPLIFKPVVAEACNPTQKRRVRVR